MKKQPNTFQKYLRRAAAALCIICVVLDTPVHAFAESGGGSPDELIDEDSTESISKSADTAESSEELISEDSSAENTSAADFSTEISSTGATVSSTDELIEESDENSTLTDSLSGGETLGDESAEESGENTSAQIKRGAMRIRRAMAAQNAAAPSFTITYEAGADSRFSNGSSENKVTYALTHHNTNITKYSHTPNIDDTGESDGDYATDFSTNDIVTVPGATKLTIDVWYSTDSIDWLAIYPAGITPSDSNYASASISGGKLSGGSSDSKSNATHKQFTVNGDTAQLYFKSNNSWFRWHTYGYYATITADGYDSYDAASGTYEEPVPNNSQNSFLGWYTDTSYSSKIEDPITLKTNSTVYAKIARYTDTGTWGTCPWGITKDGVLEIGAGTGAEQILDLHVYSPWNAYSDKITAIKAIGAIKAPANCDSLFKDLSKAASADLKNFDTGSVTDMSGMFNGCSSLTALDVSGWNTSKVMYMGFMFKGCSALTSLDVSKWNTDSVTWMAYMFEGCSSLTSLDVSKWNTSKVTSMHGMFYGCRGLTSLDVSNWDTGSVKDMSSMFSGCKALTSLDVSNWNTGSVTDMNQMFVNCSGLSSLDVSEWNTSSVTDMGEMFFNCSGLSSLDVSGWNTSKVTGMGDMFCGCSGLTSLDISEWNTGSATFMGGMFERCKNLASLDVSNWNTGSVTYMGAMFHDCSNLAVLDVSKWNTSKVTNMYGMFQGCKGLTSLDVSKWDTNKVTDMKYMFRDCSGLTSLDVSNWNTDSVTIMGDEYEGGIFEGCSGLTSLNVSNWNTGNVTDMSRMFSGCGALTSLDVSNWNTSKVTKMRSMFNGCNSLASLNLSKFDMSNVSDSEVDAMLQGTCLDKITLGAKCILSNTFWNVCLSAKNTGVYTGKWTYPSAENHENAITSSALMGQYETAGSGVERTWYAEKYSGYTITFDANGGTGSMQSQTISNTGAIQENSFLNVHHTFSGWNTKADGTGTAYADKAQITPAANMTLYAQWKPFTYTIIFDGNGHTSGTMANETMSYGTAKALSENSFVKTGHVFTGWNTKPDGNGTAYKDGASVENLSEDNGSTVTLYAQWGESTELPNTGGHGTRELEAGAVTGMGICLAAAIISRKHQNTVI